MQILKCKNIFSLVKTFFAEFYFLDKKFVFYLILFFSQKDMLHNTPNLCIIPELSVNN